MLLYLMRHAAAGGGESEGIPVDNDPGLTPQGMVKARGAARGLVRLEAHPSVVLSSPLLRALQTSEIVSEELGLPPDQIRRSEALRPGSPVKLFLEELSGIGTEEVLCVGHSPDLDDFVSRVLRCPSSITALKKASVACLQIDSLSPAQGVLLWLHPQKVLRRLGK
jgi:phosphohistidine phosphatase